MFLLHAAHGCVSGYQFNWVYLGRTAEDDAALGAFLVYVPEGYEAVYENLMRSECDESWARCILNLDKLAVFTP